MRRIFRLKLSARAEAYLARLGAQVDGAPARERVKAARRLWRQARRTSAFREIRRKLWKMATGRRRCMYCEDSMGVHVDHFWPMAAYPERAFRWQNHLFACTYCNSHKKLDQFPLHPVTGSPLLVKPTRDDPRDHLVFLPTTGKFGPRDGSPKGTPTIKVFGLNSRYGLPAARRTAFRALQRIIEEYARCKREGLLDVAAKMRKEVVSQSFSAIFGYLLEIAESPRADAVISPECLAALKGYPEIRGWLRQPKGRKRGRLPAP